MKKILLSTSATLLLLSQPLAFAYGTLNQVETNGNYIDNAATLEAQLDNNGSASEDGDIAQAAGQVAIQQGVGYANVVSMTDSKVSNGGYLNLTNNVNEGFASNGGSIQQGAGQIISQQSAVAESKVMITAVSAMNLGEIHTSIYNTGSSDTSSIQQGMGQLIVQQ